VRPHVVLFVLVAVVSGLVGSASAAERQVPPMLVFARGGDLYRMTVDGSETVRLTATRAVERDPAVSSDGLRVAFTRGTKAGADELWIGDLQGRSQRKIIPRRPASIRYATTGNPAWSPDDRWIYLDRAAQGPNEICGWIYRVGADGRGLVQLTRGVHIDSRPAPSPDGSRIALTNGGCEPGAECCWLGVVDLRGRPTTDLRRGPSTRGAQFGPTWSPDGARIAFEVSDLDAGTSSLQVVDRDGSHVARITPRGLNAEEPSWSPDGEWIAFAAWRRSAGYDLYIVHPDGTGLRRLTTTKPDESSPAWIRRS
jgi:Tol biopolymer transport system component